MIKRILSDAVAVRFLVGLALLFAAIAGILGGIVLFGMSSGSIILKVIAGVAIPLGITCGYVCSEMMPGTQDVEAVMQRQSEAIASHFKVTTGDLSLNKGE